MNQETFAQMRARMVAQQLRRRGIRDEQVLDAMAAMPREAFVDPRLRDLAYEDGPLPIGCEQPISQPYVVALMLELAGPWPVDRVLEVGSGSGYVLAVLAHLGREALGLERHDKLAEEARDRLERLGLDNARILVGDGHEGRPEEGPFDAIVVSAGARSIPESLLGQLAVGGRLVVPEGGPGFQILKRIVREPDGGFSTSEHGGVAFVPLVGS